MLAAADTFRITIHGAGGHAARPHEAVDTIALAGLLINTIHHLVSRRLDPLEAGVVTIGTIHGGSVDNVIPDKVMMTGTIRSFSDKSRQLLFDEIRKSCNIIEPLGGQVDVEIIQGYPPTYNHPIAAERMEAAARMILGDDHVLESPMYMGAEDFSFLSQKAPGCFLSLGTHDPRWDVGSKLHQPNLLISEQALPLGAAILASSAIEWMVHQS
jgi:amidohydrolase